MIGTQARRAALSVCAAVLLLAAAGSPAIAGEPVSHLPADEHGHDHEDDHAHGHGHAHDAHAGREPKGASTSAESASGAKFLAAKGARDLIRAAEEGRAVIVGKFSKPEKIDLHGYAADVRVETVQSGKVERGATLRVAWEELAPSRPVRFAEGDRVLLCLESAPPYTLWQKRFPGGLDNILAVAREGEAFLRNPSTHDTHLLSHYLAFGRRGRKDPKAIAYLVEMAAFSEPDLAAHALARVMGLENAKGRIAKDSEVLIGKLIADTTRPVDMRRAALHGVAKNALRGARKGVESAARPGAELRPLAIATLAHLDGGLPPALVGQLLSSEQGSLRAIGIRYLEGKGATDEVVRLALEDESAVVRLAAADRAFKEQLSGAMENLPRFLGDPDPAVRLVVAKRLGLIGPSIVPRLVEIANTGTPAQQQGAVQALAKTGNAGGRALIVLQDEHPDEAIRTLAGIALGEDLGHKH